MGEPMAGRSSDLNRLPLQWQRCRTLSRRIDRRINLQKSARNGEELAVPGLAARNPGLEATQILEIKLVSWGHVHAGLLWGLPSPMLNVSVSE